MHEDEGVSALGWGGVKNMGVPAEKATKAASNAANELEYVAGVPCGWAGVSREPGGNRSRCSNASDVVPAHTTDLRPLRA